MEGDIEFVCEDCTYEFGNEELHADEHECPVCGSDNIHRVQ